VARPYTQRFLYWEADTGLSSYVVPAGHRVVVRSVIGWAELVNTGLTLIIAAKQVWLWSAPGAYASVNAAMHAVAYSGETVEIWRNAGRTGGSVAGYIFEDPTGPLGRQVNRLGQVDPLPALRTAQT
jgi:hypothetical protein